MISFRIESAPLTTLPASWLGLGEEVDGFLDGVDEGLYGWVTVNYLLGALYPPAKTPAVGTIDLGGGSVQVVFATSEPVPNPDESQLLTFGARHHSLNINQVEPS